MYCACLPQDCNKGRGNWRRGRRQTIHCCLDFISGQERFLKMDTVKAGMLPPGQKSACLQAEIIVPLQRNLCQRMKKTFVEPVQPISLYSIRCRGKILTSSGDCSITTSSCIIAFKKFLKSEVTHERFLKISWASLIFC